MTDTRTAPRTAAVIGSGFGGLALAIRLQAAGIQTTVLEKRDKPGGRAYVYEDQGFTFDGGPTVITDPSALRALWENAGKDMDDYVELLPVDPMYRLCWQDGKVFDYTNDPDRLEEQIRRFDPADVDGYKRFLEYSYKVFEKGYLDLGHKPFLNFGSMVKVAPDLMKLQAQNSVYKQVSKFIRNEHLRQAFSFHPLLVGGNPFQTSSVYTLIHALEREWGVWFARGGTGALIRGMVKLFEDLGGRLRLNAEVAKIETANGRATGVRTHDGWHGEFDAVASNGDVLHTYRDLLGHTDQGQKKARSLTNKRWSMSLFVIYFGLNRVHENLEHHMILFGPRYKELIQDIFKGPDLPDDFSLYLHNPSLTDPSLAPEGCSTYYVLSPVPHLGKADLDWDTVGPKYTDRILDYLEEHYLPGLKNDLVTCRTLTPFGFRDELNSHLGSAFSVEPVLWQSAFFRPHNRDGKIPNIYLVGAGTHPGAGIPGVVGSARATAGLMLEDFGLQPQAH
ncbi:phytoene desaturase [Wenzhouxiangella sp. XN79A]|uniref:phytoene desaturase n=1 Tax=Wenzhouxiangella sp. XN79A TaxID=2724193 RepID=UPI00144A81AD|nr:phytoene desaturase [Wenzhouxiangella sp. XN79A]NKI34003.1 phytoene desaturase [Wenzhouxiangella sp. XN79A]